MKSRNIVLDVFKGLAILSVILYHAKILTYGYLGVDIFFVIGGYLITKSLISSIEKDKFSYIDFVSRRLVRLWPLAIIISIVSFVIGYYVMLPSAFKNTCYSAIGTCTFTNNIIQYITSGSYWVVINEFKPLMHTWYLGILFQFYLLYPFVFIFSRHFSRNYVRTSIIILMIISILSLTTYILPNEDESINFYLLHARLYELVIGGLVALTYSKLMHKVSNNILPILLCLFFILLCINDTYDITKARLLFTVILTVVIILYSEGNIIQLPYTNGGGMFLKFVASLGIASYSLYLWHQVILAFYRYIINYELNIGAYILTIGLSLLIGYLSYLYIEKPLSSYVENSRKNRLLILVLCFVGTIILSWYSVKFYLTEGVVRDVPELDIHLNNPQSYVPGSYNSRIEDLYNKDFPPYNSKQNVLVVGDSYARDWINILLESKIKNINIVYSLDKDKDLRKKIAQADIIFLANHAPADKYVDYLPAMLSKKFYRVGHKDYGNVIGTIYNQAKITDNYKLTIPYRNDTINAAERIEYKGMYINLMDSIRNPDGSICLFTQDKKLISNDGIHLTKAGAQKYAQLMNLSSIFSNNDLDK